MYFLDGRRGGTTQALVPLFLRALETDVRAGWARRVMRCLGRRRANRALAASVLSKWRAAISVSKLRILMKGVKVQELAVPYSCPWAF